MHQGTYKHTVDDLIERTGLPRHFINRCSSKLSNILDRYRQHGDNNQLFYDDNGLIIFDQISQMKREGKTIPDIKETLENQLQDLQEHSQSDRNALQDEPQNLQEESRGELQQTTDPEPWVAALQEAYRDVAAAKDETIRSKEETIQSLQQNLRLLTDGRDPEKVKEEHNAKIKEATEKDQKLEQLRNEKERQEEAHRQRQQRRLELYSELESLEDKWFAGSRRQEIIAELEQLDREEENASEHE